MRRNLKQEYNQSMKTLHFSQEDIAYLRGKGGFDEGFLEYLRTFR